MKDNKSFLIGSILSAGALVLLKALIPNECRKCPVRTKPWLTHIMNPCTNCRVRGGSNSPPTFHVDYKF